MTVRLAGNLIDSISWSGEGHLQIVNVDTNQEIEVQSWSNPPPRRE